MDKIGVVVKTREIGAKIFAESLVALDGVSEVKIRDGIIKNISSREELHPSGWYDPPPCGVAILFDEKPYDRLKFMTLRNPESFPNESSKFNSGFVGIVYVSPVDRLTGMIGDIGLTIYKGNDPRIQNHVRDTYKAIYEAAELAQVGMKFSDLYKEAMALFGMEKRVVGWMMTYHDPLKINLGHTVPGSFGDDSPSGSFQDTKEFIRTKRIYINEIENFQIPENCAFTFEARLMNSHEPDLPNIFFHFIVIFKNGERKILANFDSIFKSLGMEYMF